MENNPPGRLTEAPVLCLQLFLSGLLYTVWSVHAVLHPLESPTLETRDGCVETEVYCPPLSPVCHALLKGLARRGGGGSIEIA